ncbi:MSMEG_6728 family protein [Streptomyces sp. NPDC000987]|uniref:MSMEG_6728 family protein n=1 Tax=Streptomyces sp. NPDC000987 TaxID=3154374 RepID=UPI00332720E8
MQTFLPHPDFRLSALELDRRRLGKQRVEALQVLRGLTVPGYGWRHHPAVRMWAGYEEALVRYGLEVCRVWRELGHQDSCAATLVADFAAFRPGTPPRGQAELAAAGELPPWLGDEAFHLSHRSALVRKDPDVYAARFPGVPDDLPYVWPDSDRRHADGAGR